MLTLISSSCCFVFSFSVLKTLVNRSDGDGGGVFVVPFMAASVFVTPILFFFSFFFYFEREMRFCGVVVVVVFGY